MPGYLGRKLGGNEIAYAFGEPARLARPVVYAVARGDLDAAALDAWLLSTRRIGRDITRAGIIAALYQEGVQNVALTSPGADIAISHQQAGHCTAITLTDAGVGE